MEIGELKKKKADCACPPSLISLLAPRDNHLAEIHVPKLGRVIGDTREVWANRIEGTLECGNERKSRTFTCEGEDRRWSLGGGAQGAPRKGPELRINRAVLGDGEGTGLAGMVGSF